MKIIHKLINAVGILIKRKILLISTANLSYPHAVKSKDGFWYCGNLYDINDIAYGIAANGVVEQEETILVQKILTQLSSDFVLLDIGANTGYYGIMSAYMFPNSKTYSFEPISLHFDSIKESVYLNRLSNVDINECALGETSGNIDIYTAGSGTTLIKEFTTNTENKLNIPIKRLDDVVKEKGISHINFIKIDVEGFEFDVLKGALDSIKTHKPILFVEICHTKDGRDGLYKNQNFSETIRLLESLEYSTQILEYGTLKKFDLDNPPAKGVRMFLFMHKDNHKNIIL